MLRGRVAGAPHAPPPPLPRVPASTPGGLRVGAAARQQRANRRALLWQQPGPQLQPRLERLWAHRPLRPLPPDKHAPARPLAEHAWRRVAWGGHCHGLHRWHRRREWRQSGRGRKLQHTDAEARGSSQRGIARRGRPVSEDAVDTYLLVGRGPPRDGPRRDGQRAERRRLVDRLPAAGRRLSALQVGGVQAPGSCAGALVCGCAMAGVGREPGPFQKLLSHCQSQEQSPWHFHRSFDAEK